MRCPDRETLMMLADGEMADAERETVEQHMAGCGACRDVVDEMRALNSIGQSALRSLRVNPPQARVLAPRRRLLRPVALGAAAMIALAVLVAAVLVMSSRDAGVIDVAEEPPSPATKITTPVARGITPLDEAYERWAAEHRRKQIPLIPMEEVANYQPPQLLPFHPASDLRL